jgi:hypothetical protein
VLMRKTDCAWPGETMMVITASMHNSDRILFT